MGLAQPAQRLALRTAGDVMFHRIKPRKLSMSVQLVDLCGSLKYHERAGRWAIGIQNTNNQGNNINVTYGTRTQYLSLLGRYTTKFLYHLTGYPYE